MLIFCRAIWCEKCDNILNLPGSNHIPNFSENTIFKTETEVLGDIIQLGHWRIVFHKVLMLH